MDDIDVTTLAGRKMLLNRRSIIDVPKKINPNKKTPPKVTALKKGMLKKSNDSPKKQRSAQKANKRNREDSVSNSAKKLKPFAGTSEMQTSDGEKGIKEVKSENTAKNEEGKGKKKSQFHFLTVRVKAGDREVVKTLSSKIRDIEGRGELSKTARRKLKLLIKLRRFAEGGGPPAEIKPVKLQSVKNQSPSSKRRERRKKNTVSKAVELPETTVKTIAKPDQDKSIGKAIQKGKRIKQQPKKIIKQDDSDNESGEDDSDEVEEGEEEEDESGSGNAEEESGEEEGSEEGEEESSDEAEEEESDDHEEEEESEEETPPQAEESKGAAPKKKVQRENTDNKTNNSRPVNLDELKKTNLVAKNQKRFVLFVGNIPYDTNKLDLIEHFKKCGEIKHIRIPTEKQSSKPRGFAYVEVGNEETYQKCLSLHHTFLKNRRINVLYTQGGKKKGEDKKKEIKAKNFKLHAMRKQGKLMGSKKETQKRSFRRAKQRNINSEQETQD